MYTAIQNYTMLALNTWNLTPLFIFNKFLKARRSSYKSSGKYGSHLMHKAARLLDMNIKQVII